MEFYVKEKAEAQIAQDKTEAKESDKNLDQEKKDDEDEYHREEISRKKRNKETEDFEKEFQFVLNVKIN